MVGSLKGLFYSNERDINRYMTVVQKINALEPKIEKMSNHDLRQRTSELKEEVKAAFDAALERLDESQEAHVRRGAERKILDEILSKHLVEAFAIVREAAKRTLGQRHYDVQLVGGMVCHDGRVAELKTGEGKTLMATLPLYLNALACRGAHLVTANDYLSKVGAVWMGPIYHLLGLSVGIIQGQSPETGDMGGSYLFDPTYTDADERYLFCRPCTRREAYECDVTYGTNNEFGFDYLRDNMSFSASELVQRELNFAIVDEVDSILIDEARTPLIISGMVDQPTDKYYTVNRVVAQLRAGKDLVTDKDNPDADRYNPNIDYIVDEKQKTVAPTDAGIQRLERALGVKNLSEDAEIMHHVTAAMKAYALFKKDIDYVVKDGEIVIVDEFTGRLMFGRRYSDGLHEAIEAKENVAIKHESQTLATITFQNLFRLYRKLSGMTGTAKTEEDEFRRIYGLDVVVVPTNRPMIRRDQPDVVYKTSEHKYRGIAAEILRLYTKQQPVLVGTRSIEMSELVSSRIAADRLQLLALVSILRQKIEDSKTLDKNQRNQFIAMLNSNLDQLSMSRLMAMAKQLEASADPLSDENKRMILTMLELPENEETLANLDEALRHGIPHNVLNAKYHEKEAIIISEAGRKGAVTIATNMAGRGVDILLGGKPKTDDTAVAIAPSAEDSEEAAAILSYRRGGKQSTVLQSVTTLDPEEHRREADEVCNRGGLFILGTERHESRRIDNQLRGRSGRQGDPGESRFFVSLEDELWRLFGDRSQHPFLKMWPEDQPSGNSKLLSRMIERAQKKVEQNHFEARKNILQYDDVMTKQRELIYQERRRILEGVNLRETIVYYLQQLVNSAAITYCPDTLPRSEWDIIGLFNELNTYFPLVYYIQPDALQSLNRNEILDTLAEIADKAYVDREAQINEMLGNPEAVRDLERHIALNVINGKWTEHLANMDYLKEGINLRSYGQRDPLVEYQREAFDMFEGMQQSIQDEIVQMMFHVQFLQPQRQRMMPTDQWTNQNGAENGGGRSLPGKSSKVGRNDPCPCGSGKKYKKCCGA